MQPSIGFDDCYAIGYSRRELLARNLLRKYRLYETAICRHHAPDAVWSALYTIMALVPANQRVYQLPALRIDEVNTMLSDLRHMHLSHVQCESIQATTGKLQLDLVSVVTPLDCL